MRPTSVLLCLLLCLTWHGSKVRAQQTHTITSTFHSKKIEIGAASWQGPDSSGTVSVTLDITNRYIFPLTRVQVSFVASDRNGVRMQHNGSATIRKTSQAVDIEPEAQQTIRFPRAFSSKAVTSLSILSVTAEFSNGSLEILQ